MRIVRLIYLALLLSGFSLLPGQSNSAAKLDSKRLASLTSEAVRQQQSGDHAKAISAFTEIITASGGTAEANVYYQRGVIVRGPQGMAVRDRGL